MVTGSSRGAAAHSQTLHERYVAYCRAQGRELLNVIPREGVRELIRHFRGQGEPVRAMDADMLDWLAGRCEELLPLPPFEQWAEDFYRSRAAYDPIPGPPMAPAAPDGSPVTVEVRSLAFGGHRWTAGLALRPAAGGWTGHIRFHAREEGPVYATGEVFREGSPLAVRERFQAFDDHTLGAFLRSALP